MDNLRIFKEPDRLILEEWLTKLMLLPELMVIELLLPNQVVLMKVHGKVVMLLKQL